MLCNFEQYPDTHARPLFAWVQDEADMGYVRYLLFRPQL